MDPKSILDRMRAVLGKDDLTALKEISSNDPSDPFRVLIGTILSHRTRDEKTAAATARLFHRFKGAKELSGARSSEVVELIRGVGFYRVKSKRIIQVARIITEQYGGNVPDTVKELMKLPSVGRKTANCVMVYGFDMDAIPVDTHVHRIANRLGIVNASTPEGTEKGLVEFFPKEEWKEVNDLFVSYGKKVCKPIGPKCGGCILREDCAYYKKLAKTGKVNA